MPLVRTSWLVVRLLAASLGPARQLAPPLLALTLALAPAPGRAERAPAELRAVTFHSEAFGADRTLLVRLPPGYATSGQRYPVVYFTDGDQLLPTVAGVVQLLAESGALPEMILVGIRHADRAAELTPTRGRDDGPLTERRNFPTAGGADRLLASLEREVFPRVEGTWRTEPCRLLAGHSLGGLFVLHTLTARPDLFRARLAISPTLPWDGELPLRAIRALLASKQPLAGALVVTLGDEGKVGAAALAAYEAALIEAPAALRTRVLRFPGEDHGSVILPSLYEGLRTIFAGWRPPVPEDEDVGLRGGMAAVERHYRALSVRFGYVVPIPEEVLNLAGYQALRDHSPEEALRIFERNVELHPESPNVYDSLGEAFERSGDLKTAAIQYQRAWALGEQQHDPRTRLFKEHALRAQLPRP
jgi:predicted alpha/beta superfamily hydrolase